MSAGLFGDLSFLGLRSLWTIPAEWICSNPYILCQKVYQISVNERGFWRQWVSLPKIRIEVSLTLFHLNKTCGCNIIGLHPSIYDFNNVRMMGLTDRQDSVAFAGDIG